MITRTKLQSVFPLIGDVSNPCKCAIIRWLALLGVKLGFDPVPFAAPA